MARRRLERHTGARIALQTGPGHRLLAGAFAGLALAVASKATFAASPPHPAAVGAKADATQATVHIVPAARREDWRWLDRYPDEAAHRKAERADLQAVIDRLRQPNERLAQLMAERVPIDNECGFYWPSRPLPPQLQLRIDASNSSLRALADVFALLQQDIEFIVAKYGNERGHLRKLWGGAPPGSIGFLEPLRPPSR